MTRLDGQVPTPCARCGTVCRPARWARGMCSSCASTFNVERGTAQARGYGAEHRRRRAAVVTPGARCHWCGAQATQADHVRPVAHGGVDGPMVPACASCNAGRTARIGHGASGPGGRGRVAAHESPPEPLPTSSAVSNHEDHPSASGVDPGAAEGLIR